MFSPSPPSPPLFVFLVSLANLLQSFNRRSKSRSSHDSTHRKSKDRNSKESRSSSMSRQPHMQRRDHSLGRRGSEHGSSRIVYGHESGSRSVGNVRLSADGMGSTEEAKWIHRDKLAKIESEELHQAALLFHRRTGTESKVSRGRSHISGSSVTTPPTEQTEPWPDLHGEQQGADSFDANGTADVDDERKYWDLRRPEEIAADDGDDAASSLYHNPALRKSSSRIPIPTSSPAPILSEQKGRDFSRSRAPIATDEDAASTISRPRRASEPLAVESDSAPTPPSGSRPNSRGAQTTMQNATNGRKTTAKGTSTNRKTSAPATTRKNTPRSRATSAANGSQRPNTRSETRPTTAVNRPEGDPPWLATMYKPDPRLPPDQQIIPTHARQMQQEQWEKEGKTPTTYDREFAPLAISPDEKPRPANDEHNEKIEKPAPEEPQKQEKPEPEGNTTWPLSSPRSPPEPARPSTGTGYSPMPKVQEPPPAGLTPKWSPPVVTAQDPQPPKEKKGGCGCCIVM